MITMEKVQFADLVKEMTENYSSARNKIFRQIRDNLTFYKEFGEFIGQAENHRFSDELLKAVEKLIKELGSSEAMYFVQNLIKVRGANDWLGNSDVIFRLLKSLNMESNTKEFVPTEKEIQEIARKYGLTVKNSNRTFEFFYSQKIKKVIFGICVQPIKNEIYFFKDHYIDVKEPEDYEWLQVMKNEIGKFMVSKIENDPHMRLLHAAGQIQVKVF
jgi:hypothetical protein